MTFCEDGFGFGAGEEYDAGVDAAGDMVRGVLDGMECNTRDASELGGAMVESRIRVRGRRIGWSGL